MNVSAAAPAPPSQTPRATAPNSVTYRTSLPSHGSKTSRSSTAPSAVPTAPPYVAIVAPAPRRGGRPPSAYASNRYDDTTKPTRDTDHPSVYRASATLPSTRSAAAATSASASQRYSASRYERLTQMIARVATHNATENHIPSSFTPLNCAPAITSMEVGCKATHASAPHTAPATSTHSTSRASLRLVRICGVNPASKIIADKYPTLDRPRHAR